MAACNKNPNVAVHRHGRWNIIRDVRLSVEMVNVPSFLSNDMAVPSTHPLRPRRSKYPEPEMHIRWHEKTGSGLNQNKCYLNISKGVKIVGFPSFWTSFQLLYPKLGFRSQTKSGDDLPDIRSSETRIHWTYDVYSPVHKWSVRYKLYNV